MKVEYHPAVYRDVADALRFYDSVSTELADEFLAELRRMMRLAAANPKRFHLVKQSFRRTNLHRFPYHFIYRELPDGIRVTIVRHNRRDPSFGMDRD